jgi:hypothetical protein
LLARQLINKQCKNASEDAAHWIPGNIDGEFHGLEIDTLPPDVAPLVGKMFFRTYTNPSPLHRPADRPIGL